MEIKFKSQICTTVEQSKKLLELGLNPETADCHYPEIGINNYGNFVVPTEPHYKSLPAWSLHRLMEILETTIIAYSKDDNPYEDVIYNISESIKNGYFNKEYLKQ